MTVKLLKLAVSIELLLCVAVFLWSAWQMLALGSTIQIAGNGGTVLVLEL